MRSRWLLVLSFALMVTAVGCGDEGAGTADEDMVETAMPEPTPTVEVADFPDQAPREVAVELTQARLDEDQQLAYDRLVSNFHLLEFDEAWVHSLLAEHITILEHYDVPTALEDWETEQHNEFVVVRDSEIPLNALVLRPDDGEWRWDPGDRWLGQSWHRTRPEEVRETPDWSLWQVHHERYDGSIDVDNEKIFGTPLREWAIQTLAERDDGPELTIAFSVFQVMTWDQERFSDHLAHDTIIDLNGISWQAGDKSGPVEVIWTNAKLDEHSLILPGSPEIEQQQSSDHGTLSQEAEYVPQLYSVTFRLVDFPDGAEEATLEIEEILLGPLGEDAPVFQDDPIPIALEYSFPVETTPEILLGEVPDFDDVSDDARDDDD